jgi:ATP-binding cassette, subfamily B (MDR/TAP), member 1
MVLLLFFFHGFVHRSLFGVLSLVLCNVFSHVPDISATISAGSDLVKLLDSVSEIDAESKEGKVVHSNVVKSHLRLDNIHFRYHPTIPGTRVLRDFTLEVEPSTYIALSEPMDRARVYYVRFTFHPPLLIADPSNASIQLIERFYDPLARDLCKSFEISGLSLRSSSQTS